MSQELKRQIEEIVAITHNPTIAGCEKVERLTKHANSQIRVVAVAAALAIYEEETLDMERFLLLLNLDDLN